MSILEVLIDEYITDSSTRYCHDHVLAGCAGVQKQDWPTCAAVGGVTGAALGPSKAAPTPVGVR